MACRSSARPPARFPTRCRRSAGILVAPNDVTALARTLRMLIENRKEREWLAAGARKAAATLPTWQDSARLFAARSRRWHERLFRRMAGAARAVRPSRAQRRGAGRRGGGARRPAVAHDRRSRLRHRIERCARSPAHQGAAELAAGRQRSQPAGARAAGDRAAASPSRPCRSISPTISRPRSTARSIWSPRRRCSISCPDEWLERLVVEAAARRLPLYAALTYDGRIELTPADAGDAAIVAAVNTHQRTDKGFGPALGPAAAPTAIARFEAARLFGRAAARRIGRLVRTTARSRCEMLSGWAAAAREIGGIALADIVGWLTRRRDGDRRPFINPRRSRRYFRAADRHALSGQVAVEQHLVVEPMHAHRRQQRLVGAFDRRQRKRAAAGAEDDRRDHDVQPVEAVRGKKARHGVGAALDQDAAQPTLGQRDQDRGRRDLSVASRQLARSRCRPATADVRRSSVTTSRRTPSRRKKLRAGWQPAAGSITTRAGCGPATRRTVSCGSSASAVPTPTTTASTRARSRCRWASPAGPLMYFEWPEAVAIRPSSDWPIWPTTISPSDRRSAAARTAPPMATAGGLAKASGRPVGTAVQESIFWLRFGAAGACPDRGNPLNFQAPVRKVRDYGTLSCHNNLPRIRVQGDRASGSRNGCTGRGVA